MDMRDRSSRLRASSALSAICCGVIGRCGDCSGRVKLPVIAQVMKVFCSGAATR
jgi:hypothetical protein